MTGGNSPAGPTCPPAVSSVPRSAAPAAQGVCLEDGLLAISGLTRALGGNAQLSDIGALMWVLVRQIVPCDAMALFLPDETHDHVVVRFAAGAHAPALRGVMRPTATGMAGWVAVNRVPIVNGEPILDLGFRAESSPALRSSIAVPLVESDAVVAVLALYTQELLGFTADHLHALELLAPNLAISLLDAVIADEDSLYTSVPRPVASLKLVRSR